MEDWKKEIGIAFLVRQLVADLDTEDLWPFHLPEVAATEDNLVEAERTLGQKLDGQYREFLRYANGWKAFSQNVDLFGTADLEGSSKFLRANELIDTLEPLDTVCGIKRDACMPIAVSEDDIDVFFLASEKSSDPGAVFWFAGTLIERFDSFEEFFLAMVDYNRLDAKSLKDGEQESL